MPDNRPIPPIDEMPPGRGRPIVLRSTTTAALIGPAASGPVEQARAIGSAAEFAQVYGGPAAPQAGGSTTAFLAHAVRGYFAEGGTRVYVVRIRDGVTSPAEAYEAGLGVLSGVADVSAVAAPGSTYVAPGGTDRSGADLVAGLLIRHAEQQRDRIAVLDPVNDLDIDGIRAQRHRSASSYAALYYPWLRTKDPVAGQEILLPPSGFVAGVLARVDVQRGPWIAPASETIRLADGLERTIDGAQSELLGRAGVNVFRELTGRGVVLWGARTTSDDPQWQYVNIRRYATFLESSIAQGLQWSVFEPNAEALWSSVRATVEAFLATQWRAGALAGNTPPQAYFVRCDRSTLTQDDLDQGRVDCVVGVALLRPAEFVIIRIGLWTADRRP